MVSTFLILFTSIFFAYFPIKQDVSIQENTAAVSFIEEMPYIEFQVYGELLPDGYADSESTITEAYGFWITRVAGCEVTDELTNRAHNLNNASLKAMNSMYGKDWQKKFTKETGLKLAIPFN